MENMIYNDIAPLADNEVHNAITQLLEDPGFKHAVGYVIPNIDWDAFCETMLSFKSREDFQSNMISPVMWALAAKVTKGLEGDGWENMEKDKAYSILTNHRDIVLDSAFLNILMVKNGYPTTEIAIGDNLLIHPWIETLVRLNKSFIVRRGVSVRQMLEVSKHLSGYIHYAINEKKSSIWMAQREGRAKDANDRTQESVLKMLSLAPEGGSFIDNLMDANVLPVSISYEYDPCDYLKAQEFQLKRDNPEFKKSQRDDLFSMETGILGDKGRVFFRFGKCINEELEHIKATESDKRIQATMACKAIDKQIYTNYELFPCNYIAYEMLYNENRFTDKYTVEDKKNFEDYLAGQLQKVEIPKKEQDIDFLKSKILTMYSNTLKNHLKTLEE